MTAMHKSLWNIPRHPGVLCVIALLGTFAAGMLPAGTIIHVDPDAPGSGTGSDWTNATTSLSDALASALDGDEIWVRAGTYTPAPSNALRETTFTLKTGVALYGGFSGSETNRDARDPELNRTVLSGDLNGDDGDAVNGPWADMGENAYHVVTATNVADAVLDGFTITRGWSWQATGWNSGGAGLLVIESGITFLNCTVTGNMAHSGSGMYLYDSPASISNCTFSGNWAVDGRGGAIYHRAADYEVPVTVTIRASRFLNNVAMPGGGPGDAGAIWCSFSSPLDIDGCLFEGNEARWRFTYGSMAAGGAP